MRPPVPEIVLRHLAAITAADDEKLHALANALPGVFVWITAYDGTVRFVSDGWLEHAGLSRERIQEDWPGVVMHPEDRARSGAAWKDALENGVEYECEVRIRADDNSYRRYALRAFPYRDDNGALSTWVGTVIDIEDYRSSEESRLIEGTQATVAVDRARAAQHFAEAAQQKAEAAQHKAEDAQHVAEAGRAVAEASDKAKTTFVSDLSHEIRTPLTAILGYTDLLLSDSAGTLTEKQRAYSRRIRQSSQHIMELLNELLEIAKAQSGTIALARDVFSILESIDSALPFVETQAARKGIHVQVTCETAQDRVVGDGDRVRQILINLLSNAVKFTPPDGSIRVHCELVADGRAPNTLNGTWLAVQIMDTGIGIPEDKLEVIFDPFVQLGTHRSEGTGLGLSISRNLARLMGGEITVSSKPGSGSMFTLWLRSGMG